MRAVTTALVLVISVCFLAPKAAAQSDKYSTNVLQLLSKLKRGRSVRR